MAETPKKHFVVTAKEWKRIFGHDPSPENLAKLVPDWRWSSPKRIRMDEKLGGGVPADMRRAVEAIKAATGLPMIEFVRRCVAKELKALGTSDLAR